MKQLLLTINLLLFVAGLAMGQQRTVVGTVNGDDGETLVGASVRVKGLSVGATADAEGKFTLQVPAGSNVLVFAYTGYATQEVTLGASNVVNVVLLSGQVLQEAVVTALGITRSEKALGYSVSKVEGSTVTGSGEVNAVQALAAKSAGVQVIGSAGTPGASSKILIRGNSSFQLNNQPLIVIDNVPYDNAVNTVSPQDYPFNPNLQGVNESNRALDINPEDIENISVLKGPAASALYGTRAANGVILITTKKGKKGTLSVSYNASYDITEVNKLPELQDKYGNGNTGGSTLVTDASGNVIGSKAEGVAPAAPTPNSWGPAIAPGAAFDNLDTYFQQGTTLTNNLSISGGSDKTNFRLSYGNTSQTGIVPNTYLNRNTFRVNASTGVEKFQVSVTAAYSTVQDSKAQNGSNLSGVMLPLLRMPADFNLIGGTAENGYTNLDGSQHTYLPNYDNPLWTAYRSPNKSNVGRFTGALAFDFTPLDWMTLTFRIGTDMYNDERHQVVDIGNNNYDPRGEVWESNNKHEEINTDLLARFKHSFGDISTNLLVGTQLNHRYDESKFARGQNLAVPNFYNLSNASILYADNLQTFQRLAGLLFTFDIGYKELVYLTVGGRNDYASTFGPQAKSSFFYPNTSLSFILSELIPKNDLVSYIKLRASYAQAGREPLTYSSRTYYARPFFTDGFTNGNSFPYLGQNGFTISNILGNNALRPEINTTYEGGVDLRLWKNRVRASFTYYLSKSKDLLVVRPIANTSGFRFFISNVGAMENKGIELEADADLVKTRNFTWTLGGNFTQNINEVTALAEGVNSFSIASAFADIGSYAIEGQPYGAVFGTYWQRDAQGRLVIGANGLPNRVAAQDFLGNPYPDFTAAVRNAFTFKGITLSGLLDIRKGGILWNGTWARLNRIGRTKESADGRDKFYVIDGVKEDGTPNDIKITSFRYYSIFKGDGAGNAAENAIQDGGWLRLREVTLSYTLPKFSSKVKDITVYATGRNLWLKTDYTGVDPETSLTGAGSNIGGFDYFNMPGARSYIVGLRSNF